LIACDAESTNPLREAIFKTFGQKHPEGFLMPTQQQGDENPGFDERSEATEDGASEA
jgi:hypothetical protein